jgi:hypothetical protein
MATKSAKNLEICFCYSDRDMALYEQLYKYIKALKRFGQIYTRHVLSGENYEMVRQVHLYSANVILLLISASFLANERCYEEALYAIQRHQAGDALVIAVLLRPSLYQDYPFENVPILPSNQNPITSWLNLDEAFLEVTMQIGKLLLSRYMNDEIVTSIELLYCYARKDKKLRDQLAKHLEPLRRSGEITTWYDHQILGGDKWQEEIDAHLNSADIILLLISSNFLASDYCSHIEMRRALERHEKKEARVIPIILDPVDWQSTPLGALQALPRDGKPVTTWRNRSQAFLNIVQGIQDVLALSPEEVIHDD